MVSIFEHDELSGNRQHRNQHNIFYDHLSALAHVCIHDRIAELYGDQQRHDHAECGLKCPVIELVECAMVHKMVCLNHQTPECSEDHDRDQDYDARGNEQLEPVE